MADVLRLPRWVEKYYQDYFDKLEMVRYLFKAYYKELKNG